MMKKSLALVVIFFLAMVSTSCSEKKSAPPVKKIGPAGAVVQSFFKNWEFQRFDQMYEQTVHSRDRNIFTEAMQQTPIKWRDVVILSEEPNGEDWDVTLSLEVTDIASAFAACLINLKYSPSSKKPAFIFTPGLLGIHKFMPIKQTWRVINLDGKYFIDICAGGSKGERYENIMNYVLDASDIDSLPSLGDDSPATKASVWLSMMIIDMDIPKDKLEKETEDIIERSVPLFEEGEKNLKNIAKKISSAQ